MGEISPSEGTIFENFISEKQEQRARLKDLSGRLKRISQKLKGDTGCNEVLTGKGEDNLECLKTYLDRDISGTEYLISEISESISEIEKFI